MRYWQAVNRALLDAMEADPSVVLVGEDVGAAGGPFGATRGLLDRFGATRVRDTPISELAIAGLGVGAAMAGLRPVVEIMFNDFLTLAMDPIVNQAAKLHFMTGGRAKVPLVIRTLVASRSSTGPQHGQSLEAWLAHVPGLKVVSSALPSDAYGLLRAAIADDNPVVVFESLSQWRSEEDFDPASTRTPIGTARIDRVGSHVTLVAWGSAFAAASKACEIAEAEGVDVELIDLRSLSPLDHRCLRQSLEKTGRLVCAYDGAKEFGIGAEIAAWASEEAFDLLHAPVARVAAPDSPPPFPPTLESYYFPTAARIAEACVAATREP
jgi:acetoin:2,6-dichlorophenolindophenol oxidoreductase subunit beta